MNNADHFTFAPLYGNAGVDNAMRRNTNLLRKILKTYNQTYFFRTRNQMYNQDCSADFSIYGGVQAAT